MRHQCNASGFVGMICKGESDCYMRVQFRDLILRNEKLPSAQTLRKEYTGCVEIEKIISEYNLDENGHNN